MSVQKDHNERRPRQDVAAIDPIPPTQQLCPAQVSSESCIISPSQVTPSQSNIKFKERGELKHTEVPPAKDSVVMSDGTRRWIPGGGIYKAMLATALKESRSNASGAVYLQQWEDEWKGDTGEDASKHVGMLRLCESAWSLTV